MSLDINLTNVQAQPIVVSSNTTAENYSLYNVVANATFTDPTPIEGGDFKVFVINGTAIIGGTSYGANSLVFRKFHSGVWTNTLINVDLSGYVPTSRTINGLDLTTNRTLTASDVGAPSGSGTSTGTNTGDETQSSILSKLGFFIYNRTADSTAVTGTTTETIIDSVLIPENTYSSSGGILRLYNVKFAKTGTVANFRIKIYVGPNAGNLTGATLLADSGLLGTTILYTEMLRTFTVGASTLKGMNSTVVVLSDVASSATARGSIVWNPAIDNYIHFTVANSSALDSTVMIGNSVKNF